MEERLSNLFWLLRVCTEFHEPDSTLAILMDDWHLLDPLSKTLLASISKHEGVLHLKVVYFLNIEVWFSFVSLFWSNPQLCSVLHPECFCPAAIQFAGFNFPSRRQNLMVVVTSLPSSGSFCDPTFLVPAGLSLGGGCEDFVWGFPVADASVELQPEQKRTKASSSNLLASAGTHLEIMHLEPLDVEDIEVILRHLFELGRLDKVFPFFVLCIARRSLRFGLVVRRLTLQCYCTCRSIPCVLVS